MNIKKLKKIAATVGIAAIVSFLSPQSSAAISSATCKVTGGRLFNPVSDPNWTNMFPVTTAGAPIGPGINPPGMFVSPVCVCPSRALPGVPVTGIGASFWDPGWIAEIDNIPGCSRSLGGIPILPGFDFLSSEASSTAVQQKAETAKARKQMHIYKYPVFAVLDVLSQTGCASTSGFALAYMSEIDVTFQDDIWGAIFSPESVLFALPPLQIACAVDAVSAMFYYPIDALFWCNGSAGSAYPLTGNNTAYESMQMMNHAILSRGLYKLHRTGLLWATMGAGTTCSSIPFPFLKKTQYRIDPVWPVRSPSANISLGESEFKWGILPPSHFPSRSNAAYLIWQGKRCCVRP